MHSLLRDIKYGFRNFLKRPGFTAIAVITLALGIGANTAIFSLVNTVLLRPLPVARPHELVEVYGTFHNGADYTIQSYLNYKDYRDRNDVFSGLVAYRFAPMSMSNDGRNERLWGYLVSGNYFDVLGVQPVMGRSFLPEEDKTLGTHPVTVITHACWQKRFASDPKIVGRTVSLNGHPFNVIGVAPEGFNGTEVAYGPEFFVPFMMAREIEPGSNWIDFRDSDNLFVVGRLKPGVTTAQAESSLLAITLQLAKEFPKENEGRGVRLLTPGLFIPDIRNSVISFSGVLMGVVGLVLLLACVNLANLLLARATERRKELAIRLAVGASRVRIVRQLVTESVMLSLAGGLGGLLLAVWINGLVASIKLPTDIAIVFPLHVDWRVLIFAVIVSLGTGIVFSLLPALQSSRPDLVPALKDETSMGGFRRSRLRNALVVVQVALSLILLVCAGLVVRSLQVAQRTRPGFNPDNAVALSFDLGLQGYTEEKGRTFQRQLLERAESVAGVRSVALTSTVPLTLDYSYTQIYIEGQPLTPNTNLPVAVPNEISPNYFRTMEIPLRGRDFTERDSKEESRVAIINESFARRLFPNQEAIGRRFNFSGPDKPYWEVIGVAADGKYNSLAEDQKMAFYRPILRDYNTNATLVARISGDSGTVISGLRGELQRMDASLPLYNVQTLSDHMNVPLFPFRMAATVLGSFGVLAIVLAAIGIYGVMSYVVAGRTREIGVRIALGAGRGDVLGLILRQGMSLAAIGLVIGFVLALGAAQLLAKLLFGVSPLDVVTFGAVSLLLAFVAALACYIPARRATKVDP
ncbi:MAG TPA: ABC transporter permease, partial [Pyrinomonadaceae bacterium]|nr:ABC transporter permease [Pyrinomonadaceae bacterium]